MEKKTVRPAQMMENMMAMSMPFFLRCVLREKYCAAF